ncbi:MAG: cobaltochelatase subunit CobN, partial [Candidatus Muiribacteriaceae bacterium]
MKKIINRKTILILITLAALYFLYSAYISPTYIAYVGYKDFQFAEIVKIKQNPFVRLHRLERDQITEKDLTKYSFITLFGMGLNLDPEQKDAIRNAISEGSRVYIYASTNQDSDLSNVLGDELKYIEGYMGNGGIKNTRNLLNYVRRNIDGKRFFTEAIEEPVRIPHDTVYHKGVENYFTTYEEYQEFYRNSGLYKKDRPRVA